MKALNKQALREAAEKATALNLDTAQVKRGSDGYLECPCCEGAGYVEEENDFCNIDGVALGVQFYGIGEHHGLAELYLRAANPATMLALLDELEAVQKTAAARLEAIDRTHKMFQRERDRADAAEKRIAELEARAFNPAILDVIAERQRQQSVEGWTPEHDNAYQNSELADAAACYATHAHNQGFSTPAHWPWSPDWWKQSGARRDLVKAGALILAEIERIDRAAGIGVKGE